MILLRNFDIAMALASMGAVIDHDQGPEAGATIFVGAPTHRGGSGGPARVIATF